MMAECPYVPDRSWTPGRLRGRWHLLTTPIAALRHVPGRPQACGWSESLSGRSSKIST